MIAAARRRIGKARRAASGGVAKWTRRADSATNRGLERSYPALRRAGRQTLAAISAVHAWLGPRLRPPAAAFFRGLAIADARVRQACTVLVRVATAASEVVTPRRAIGAVICAAGIGLAAAQFIEYRGVEIGQPGYTGLADVAKPPTVAGEVAGDAHAYVLLPLGILAALLGLACARRERPRLGLAVLAIGLFSVATILLVDRPAGLDEGLETARFAGVSAVLDDGFYAELAAAAGLLIAGLLYYARPCRIRISSSGRAASARRRRPRRPDSSRARVARSA